VINVQEEVDQLVDQGRYKEAAKVAEEAGDYSRAAELFERIWDFASAATCAEKDGDLPRALSNALEARDQPTADRYASTLQEQGEEGKRQAMAVFVKRRQFANAARLAEELGDTEDAVRWYQEGHLDFDAARVLVELGRDRDAGRVLERAIRDLDAGADRSRANLQLGLIFARLLQHESAVRCLQDAATHEESRVAAQRALVTELAALGLRDAARDLLIEVRADDPSVTPDLDAFLRAERKPTTRKTALRDARLIGGRYRLERLLGSGASGRVYRAKDEVSDKDVAIKLLANTHSRSSEGYVRFAREAKLAKNLRHTNLIEVYDFSADLGFLVMEYMRGGSLEDKLESELPATAVRRLCLDILSGLELAHQRGIIHRDLKPANIFFDARGTAKIGDFGVAHLQDLGQTQTGGLIGTLAYMSPEQITGAPLTIAADLYGVGVTLFEALTGRLPFQGPDFVAQHLGEEAPAPSNVSHSDPCWDPLVLRLLAKNPGDRFDSVDSLRRELQALQLSDESSPLMMPKARPLPSPASSATMQAVADPDSDEKEEAKERYAFETPLGKTSLSRLSRAIDTVLNRSVIIERFTDTLEEARERRLYALARGGGPFLQRALGYEKKTGVAIFEAPTGSPIGELEEALSTRLATRLLKRLARAVAPLHANDRAHGELHGGTILLDDRGHPTVLVCGLESLTEAPSPKNDVEKLMRVIASSVGEPENPDASAAEVLIDSLLEKPEETIRTELLAMPASDGEELYTLAEAIEIVLLESKQGA
jgi:serine/threonine-protein kinase